MLKRNARGFDLIIAALGGVCLLVPWEHMHKAMPRLVWVRGQRQPLPGLVSQAAEEGGQQASKEVDVMKRKAVAQLMLIDRRKPVNYCGACYRTKGGQPRLCLDRKRKAW